MAATRGARRRAHTNLPSALPQCPNAPHLPPPPVHSAGWAGHMQHANHENHEQARYVTVVRELVEAGQELVLEEL